MADDKSSIDMAFTRESLYGTGGEHAFAGALSFFRRRYSRDFSEADVAVIGVPFDTAVTNRPGARFGPRAVRAASATQAWDPEWGWTQDPFDDLAVVDAGDVNFDPGRPAQVPDEIQAAAADILATDTAILTLGGDHFITYPLLKAHHAKYGTLALLHFDAHSDTWEDEDGRIDHGTMFYHATNDGIVDPAHSAQVGLRTTNPDTMGFNVLDADFVHDKGVDATVAAVKAAIGDRPCYVTFDIDCLDPAYAPGTGTPVCGGLTTHQALTIIRKLKGLNVVGMDVVEVAPAYDVGEITALAGATIGLNLLHLYRAGARGK